MQRLLRVLSVLLITASLADAQISEQPRVAVTNNATVQTHTLVLNTNTAVLRSGQKRTPARLTAITNPQTAVHNAETARANSEDGSEWNRRIAPEDQAGGGRTPPPPVPGSVQWGGRSLVGGWRLTHEFARGAIAIDFSRNKLWMAGKGNPDTESILEFDLPAMGAGTNPSNWPALHPVRTIPNWTPAGAGYVNGLIFWRGKLWAVTRVFYDTNPPNTTMLYAQDGERLTINLPRQRFSGFVKRGPGLDPFLGGGGYESGQGSASGPTLATLAGQVLVSYGWPELPGATLEHWNERAPRPPNYFPSRHVDSWLAWEPRTVNGTRQGRWASDVLNGGGLVLPEGIVYFPWLGIDDLDYARQHPTFADWGHTKTYAYRYDASTHTFLEWTEVPVGEIGGQEIGPDGSVYLAEKNAWKSGAYQVDVAVKVFR